MNFTRAKYFMITGIMFIAASLCYLCYELFAPFCAKNPCATSSPGSWIALLLGAMILFIIGCFFLLGALTYEK